MVIGIPEAAALAAMNDAEEMGREIELAVGACGEGGEGAGGEGGWGGSEGWRRGGRRGGGRGECGHAGEGTKLVEDVD